MQCLLIGGAPSVGKTQTLYRLVKRLLTENYTVTKGIFPEEIKDFKVILEKSNTTNKKIRIIINSPSDTVGLISDFKKFYDENGTYNILISSIRDDNFWPRGEFFDIMKITNPENSILEIPLAKITRKGDNRNVALKWYEEKVDKLVDYTLDRLISEYENS